MTLLGQHQAAIGQYTIYIKYKGSYRSKKIKHNFILTLTGFYINTLAGSLLIRWLPLGLGLLVIAPLIHPARLYHFQVAFIALVALAFKVRYFQHPLYKLCKADTVYFAF